MWSPVGWWKRRPIKAMAKEDLEMIEVLLVTLERGICASSAMGERFKGRYARRHDEADNEAMGVVDKITTRLQGEYRELYRLREAKIAIVKNRELPKKEEKKEEKKVEEEAKAPVPTVRVPVNKRPLLIRGFKVT